MNAESKCVEKSLGGSRIHDGWEGDYRSSPNEAFYDLAFERIGQIVESPGSRFLDAGCGSCAHSRRLVQHGYRVCAIDFSETVVERARDNVSSWGLDHAIDVQREDILNLTFSDGEFDNVLCWGVLMHMPQAEVALKELSRVLKNGGMLVLSETNAFSMHSMTMRTLRAIAFRQRATTRWTPVGIENWEDTDAGKLMTRQTNMSWLKRYLQQEGFQVKSHMPGQFSELYTYRIPTTARKITHRLNKFWFRFVKSPRLALGNIVIAQKQSLN